MISGTSPAFAGANISAQIIERYLGAVSLGSNAMIAASAATELTRSPWDNVISYYISGGYLLEYAGHALGISNSIPEYYRGYWVYDSGLPGGITQGLGTAMFGHAIWLANPNKVDYNSETYRKYNSTRASVIAHEITHVKDMIRWGGPGPAAIYFLDFAHNHQSGPFELHAYLMEYLYSQGRINIYGNPTNPFSYDETLRSNFQADPRGKDLNYSWWLYW
jgi:hypothetical protein